MQLYLQVLGLGEEGNDLLVLGQAVEGGVGDGRQEGDGIVKMAL